MKYLEMINSEYLDLLLPLREWKILSLDDLKKLSGYQGGEWNFYKIVQKFEESNLAGSFVDHFTKKKFLYLACEGFKALGMEKMIPVHVENRFHDAHLVRLLLQLRKLPSLEKFLLDEHIKKEFPFLGHIPDALIVGKRKDVFRLGIELELTQKSKERIRESFQFYEASPFFNNVLYFFIRPNAYKTYQEVLKESVEIKNKNRFLFIFEPRLTKKSYEIQNSETSFKEKITTLGEVFSL